MGLVFEWIIEQGGLIGIANRNAAKAKIIYDAIDGSGGFYRGHAQTDSRSEMNVTFRLPNEDLEKTFVTEAKSHDMDGLKGHRSVGGIRASIYNAFPIEGCRHSLDSCRTSPRRTADRRTSSGRDGTRRARVNRCATRNPSRGPPRQQEDPMGWSDVIFGYELPVLTPKVGVALTLASIAVIGTAVLFIHARRVYPSRRCPSAATTARTRNRRSAPSAASGLRRALPTSAPVDHRLDQPALHRHAGLARLQGVSMVGSPRMDPPLPAYASEIVRTFPTGHVAQQLLYRNTIGPEYPYAMRLVDADGAERLFSECPECGWSIGVSAMTETPDDLDDDGFADAIFIRHSCGTQCWSTYSCVSLVLRWPSRPCVEFRFRQPSAPSPTSTATAFWKFVPSTITNTSSHAAPASSSVPIVTYELEASCMEGRPRGDADAAARPGSLRHDEAKAAGIRLVRGNHRGPADLTGSTRRRSANSG